MCVIFTLEAGQSIPKDMLDNAVYNNWHSYGVIVVKAEGLEVIKKCPENEVDPQEVMDLLEKYKDFPRHVHLRHNTAGATTDENTHPFLVFKDEKTGRQVWFMHNGTMYPYVSKKESRNTYNGAVTWVDDPDGPSDTVNFSNSVLRPYLQNLDSPLGKGDISSSLFRRLVRSFWNGANRGLLISSDQDAWYIDDWKEVGPEGSKFKASNNDYFLTVKRGPEYDRRENARKAMAEQERLAKTNPIITSNVEQIANFDLKPTHGFFQLSASACELVNDYEFYDRETASLICHLTVDEIAELYEHKEETIAIMDWIFTDYGLMYEELETAYKKLSGSTKKNEEFANRIKILEAELNRLEGIRDAA